jgi:hypothetical protein
MEGRGDYGYDAPYALLAFVGLGAASLVGAVVVALNGRRAATLAFYAAFFLANACSFLYTTRRGKFRGFARTTLVTASKPVASRH